MSMIKPIFMVLFIIHILADFYFQTEHMADKKERDLRWVWIHAGTYALVSLLMGAVFVPGIAWKYWLIVIVTHAAIDLAKYYLCRYLRNHGKSDLINEKVIFFADQFMHGFVIFVIAYQLNSLDFNQLYNHKISTLFSTIGLSETVTAAFLIKLLLIHKPANIAISKILAPYRPAKQMTNNQSDKNAGRLIGTLERVVMMIFISIQQYSAVGLVLTAKSIARYEKISKEQDFAEYYLLGTLLSTIVAVVVSLVF